ncbi:MAG: hypothetical protein PUC61_06785 [Bacteroidales bacterium]|nr:hypothetical protein [Bacteroidales bacterium]
MKETIIRVLETMRSAGKPVSAGEVATLYGLERKEMDKVIPAVHITNIEIILGHRHEAGER